MKTESPSISIRQPIHRLYFNILRPHKRTAFVVTIVAFAAGMLEALGLAALLPVLGRTQGSTDELYRNLLLLGALLIGSVLVRVIADIQVIKLTVAVESRLRGQFLDGLVDARWSALRSFRSGDLVTALISESSQVANGASAYLNSVVAFCIAISLTGTALIIAPLISVVAIVFAAVSFVAYRRAGHINRQNQRMLAMTEADLNEEAFGLLGNLKLLLSTGDRSVWLVHVRLKLAKLMLLRRRNLVVPTVTRALVEGLGAVFLVAAMAIAVGNGGNPASALVTLALFYRVVPRLQVAQSSLLLANTQSAWWDRWQEREQSWLAGSDRTQRSGLPRFDPPLNTIQIRAATVEYPGRARPALNSVSLGLQSGQVLAVVGHTGSGKSTLVDVLTGLITPNIGSCEINGRSLVDMDLDSWQRHIGFVPQDPPLVHGSLLENLVWLEPNIDREWAAEVVRIAALDEFVAQLPSGLDTLVGPRGTSISGGQRQRLAIGRAIYRRPSLIILDEATSALDEATDRRLLKGLITHFQTAAIVIITHRLGTVAIADEIVVLEEGCVVAQGVWGSDIAAALDRISSSKGDEFRHEW